MRKAVRRGQGLGIALALVLAVPAFVPAGEASAQEGAAESQAAPRADAKPAPASDEDGPGELSAEELGALREELLRRAGKAPAQRPVRRQRDRKDVVERADLNGDGQVDMAERRRVRARRMLERYDVNEDGRIDAEERVRVRERKRIIRRQKKDAPTGAEEAPTPEDGTDP